MENRNQVTVEWKYLSIVRAFLADFFLYPRLLCHILKYAASRDYDILDFSYRKYEGGYFIVLLGVYIVMVYLVRFLLVSRTILKLIKDIVDNEEGKCSSCRFWLMCVFNFLFFSQAVFLRFILHTICHTVAQVLLIFILFLRAKYEFDNSNGSTNVSPYFWTTLTLVYFMPQLGFFMFFPTNYINISDIFYVQDHIPCFYRTFYLCFSPVFTIISLVYSIIFITFLIVSALFYDNNSYTILGHSDINLSLNWQYFILAAYIYIVVINFKSSFIVALYFFVSMMFILAFPYSIFGAVCLYILLCTKTKIC